MQLPAARRIERGLIQHNRRPPIALYNVGDCRVELALRARPPSATAIDLSIPSRDRPPGLFLENVEDDVVAVCFRHAQSRRDRACIFPSFGDLLTFIPCFRDRGTTN